MTIFDIMRHVDLTNLNPTATHDDMVALIKDACAYKAYSICVPLYYTLFARDAIPLIAQDGYAPKLCTVIGFPHGNTMPQVKMFEAAQAVQYGADEVDMVINIGAVKERNTEFLLSEINNVAEACKGRVLKVIIETSLLTEEEKIYAAQIVERSAADFIKTSTGYGGGGATLHDIELLKKHVGTKKIKASGGISNLKFAEDIINAGANRLGSSSIIKTYEKLFESEEKSAENT